MKRWILAMLFLLGGLVGIAQADYVIIIANLGLVKQKDDAEGQAQPGVGGMAGEPGMGGRAMGGAPARGGAQPGARQGGQGQQRGGGRPAAGGGRQGGQPQQPQQPQQPGGVGMMGGPGMGMGGMMPGGGMMGGPGMGNQGMMPGGAMGNRGGMGMGGMMPGGGMGMGGMGMGGMMPGGGMGMMGMGMMGGIGGGEQTESAPFFVMTVVETKESLTPDQLRALRNNRPIIISHKWGKSVLRPEIGIDIIVMEAGSKPFPSVIKRFLARNQAAHKDTDVSVDALLDYSSNPQAGPAKFALEHRLLKEFREVMAEVEKLDPNHPKVKALQKVEKAMAQPITKPDASAQWKQRLGVRDSRQSEHYVLLYNAGPGITDAEVNSRLKALEDSYKGFFYWFAFNCDKDGDLAYVPKGKKDAPLVPDQRLISVLTGREEEFNKDHKAFDNAVLVADGFTARRDNLAVFSNERLDKQFKALNDYCGPTFQIFARDDLLKGVRSPKARNKSPRDYNIASTLALMIRSLEADSEFATVTHEAPYQLLSAIGLTHRNVVTPEWIGFGMPSFFAVTKAAPWGGAGGPNWIYLQEYKERSKTRRAGRMDKPLDALKGVVTDRYFQETNNGENEAALKKARTLAWSLTYFLAHRKLGNDQTGLIRYYRELAKMPRDLDFDHDSLLALFARSFNCLDARGDKPDDAELGQLAEEWHRFIDLTPLEGEEVVKDIRSRQTELKTGGVGKPEEKKEEDDKPLGSDGK